MPSIGKEGKAMLCLKCQGDSVKNGFQSGKQRYKCKSCGHQFITEKGRKPQWMKDFAVQLYQSRVTIRGIAKLLQVSPPTALAWIRKYAPQQIEKPQPGHVKGIQLDEVWHYLGEKNEKSGCGSLLILIQSESLIGKSALVAQLP